MNHNKPDEAKKSIELALGKLETILSTENAPKLLPVDIEWLLKNFAGSADGWWRRWSILLRSCLGLGQVQEAGRAS